MSNSPWSGSSLAQASFGCPSPAPSGMNYGRIKPIESPYLDFATLARPRTFSDMIDWSEYVFEMSDEIKNGLSKLFGYFATRLLIADNKQDLGPADLNHVMNWERLLNRRFLYQSHVMELGFNLAVYGNDFITVSLGNARSLRCRRCNWMIRVGYCRKVPETRLHFSNMKFYAVCQGHCKKLGYNERQQMEVIHHVERSPQNIIIKHWSIRELEFDFLEVRNKLRIYWRIPERIRKLVLHDQDPDTLNDLDWAALQAIVENKYLEFDDRVMFHAKEPTLSGLENRGLGIPRTLALARQHWLVQLLKKQCQSLAAAYVSPIEFFSLAQPNMYGMTGDPGATVNMAEFGNYVDEMLAAHRRDPTRKFFIPYPINYQIAGGQANQYVPVELLNWSLQQLSNSMVPMAMLQGDLTIQTAPVFIRLFESTNRGIPAIYNAFVWFLVSRISELLGYEPVEAYHAPVSVEDNLAIDQILQQGSLAGKNSDYAWQSRLALNPRWEQALMLTEQSNAMEMQREIEKLNERFAKSDQINQMAQMENPDPIEQQQMGAAGPGGQPGAAPPGPGGMLLPSQGFQPSPDVNQMDIEAQHMAQLLLQLPPAQRQAEIGIIRQSHQMFHGLLMSYIDKFRRQMGMEARRQMFPTA
ncbi:MAG: hypothetical protein KatS3mg109_0155 [Pirellulaceae bacterium]|nr:MAG: hypothetical protein KatS3mg109_0155 [Pirellulaceae bacterium]